VPFKANPFVENCFPVTITGSYGSKANDPVDGSYTITFTPELSGVTNLYDMFTGRQFSTKGFALKGTFYNTVNTSNSFNSPQLWSGETVIKVYLVLVKNCAPTGLTPFITGTEGHKYPTLHSIFNQAGTDWSKTTSVNAMFGFRDLDQTGNVSILKSWTFELAASGGDEAFLPFELKHFFKRPLLTTIDKDTTASKKGSAAALAKNGLFLVFAARGCVHMNYQMRHYFIDN